MVIDYDTFTHVGEAIFKRHTSVLCFSPCGVFVLEITSRIIDGYPRLATGHYGKVVSLTTKQLAKNEGKPDAKVILPQMCNSFIWGLGLIQCKCFVRTVGWSTA